MTLAISVKQARRTEKNFTLEELVRASTQPKGNLLL